MSRTWNAAKPVDSCWKPRKGLSQAERAQEQDAAAGGRERRFMPDGSLASVALRVQPKSRSIYAYLRWSAGGTTRERFIGQVTCASRSDNLASAWQLAHSKGLSASDSTFTSWAGSDAVRSIMRSNKGRDTRPELELRRLLHAMGLRYRMNHKVSALPRRSIDIAFPKYHLAVFVDGCYWHGCPEHYRPSTSNREFWSDKIRGNMERDRDTESRLRDAGWDVLRFWEHVNPVTAADLVAEHLRATVPRSS